jgi:chromosome segregation ATPase
VTGVQTCALPISPTGTNSHETLVLESLKVYTLDLSSETAHLQAEIADLRQRLLEANEQIQELSQQITIVSNVPATI